MFSPKDVCLPKKIIRELEAEVLEVQRELDEGRNETHERHDLWKDPDAMKKHLYSEKHIIKAFVMGVLTAQVWKSDLFGMPDGFQSTIEHVAREVQLLRFGDPKNGRIRMSMNEIVDKHMRLWIQQDENCQKWIKDKTLEAQCVLRAACDVLIYERDTFDREFRNTLAAAKEEIVADMLASDSIPPEKEKPADPPPATQTPSGTHPAIS